MKTLLDYGWILGLVCLLLGGLQFYFYFTNHEISHLIVALFVFTAGIINLAIYLGRGVG